MWKDVVGYEGYYEVSDDAVVRNKNTLKELKPRVDRGGYVMVKLCKRGVDKHILFHRIVAKAFIQQIDGKPCINHIDGNKKNNNVDNLEWCTYRENTIHAYRNKLKIPYDRSGAKHPGVKITIQVKRSVEEFLENGHTQQEASKRFNLSRGSISRIANKKTYLDVV